MTTKTKAPAPATPAPALDAEEQRGLVAISGAMPAPAGFPLPAAPPPPAITGAQQGEMRSVIIQAARKMQLTGWGAHGSTEGFIETVPYRRLWINPLYPVRYTEDDLSSLALSMLRDGQRDPIIVAAAEDKRAPQDGGMGGDLLIIDGVRRYLAVPRAGLDEMQVIVRPYHNYYDAVLGTVRSKVSQSQHPLSDLELGQLIIWLRVAHNLTRAQQPDLPKFPTQMELAALLGRSQGTISKWCKMAQMPDSVLEQLMGGAITHAQATEMLALPPEQQAQVAAEVAAANQEAQVRGAAPVPSKAVRDLVDKGGSRQTKWNIPLNPVPSGLWLGELADEQLPVAIARLLHDLDMCLSAAGSGMGRYPHPAFTALRKAIAAPEVQRHIRSVRS